MFMVPPETSSEYHNFPGLMFIPRASMEYPEVVREKGFTSVRLVTLNFILKMHVHNFKFRKNILLTVRIVLNPLKILRNCSAF